MPDPSVQRMTELPSIGFGGSPTVVRGSDANLDRSLSEDSSDAKHSRDRDPDGLHPRRRVLTRREAEQHDAQQCDPHDCVARPSDAQPNTSARLVADRRDVLGHPSRQHTLELVSRRTGRKVSQESRLGLQQPQMAQPRRCEEVRPDAAAQESQYVAHELHSEIHDADRTAVGYQRGQADAWSDRPLEQVSP